MLTDAKQAAIAALSHSFDPDDIEALIKLGGKPSLEQVENLIDYLVNECSLSGGSKGSKDWVLFKLRDVGAAEFMELKQFQRLGKSLAMPEAWAEFQYTKQHGTRDAFEIYQANFGL